MELKTKYQYTYFIYPYVVQEDKYEKYILGLLKDKKCNLKFYEKEKDSNLYNFFLPKVRESLFRNFEFTKERIKKFKEFDSKMQSRILAKYPCITFEYDIGNDVQAKTDGEENGIFFKIQKIEIICFNTGIFFLTLKTNVEDSVKFSDVLNFNYKFKDYNSELKELKNYENIHIQTNIYSNVKSLKDLINIFVPNKYGAKKLNIDTNRFYTYAYTCIEQEYWNNEIDFVNLENEFYKYMLLKKDSSNINKIIDEANIIDSIKYARIAITQTGIALLSSAYSKKNYLTLPFEFENQYFYLYLWILYKKIYLSKISKELDDIKNNKYVRRKFIKFTQNIWVYEITNDETGIEIDKKISKKFGLKKLYEEVKNKYDIMYKELNIERNSKINKYILIALIISLGFNFINAINIIFYK